MCDWLLALASMNNTSPCGRRRGRAACASEGPRVEALESGVRRWGGSRLFTHVTHQLTVARAEMDVVTVGDFALISFATDKLVDVYDANAHDWFTTSPAD